MLHVGEAFSNQKFLCNDEFFFNLIFAVRVFVLLESLVGDASCGSGFSCGA